MSEPESNTKNPATPAPTPAAAPNRRPLFVLGAIALVAVAGWTLYYLAFMRGHVTTDDAYVNGNLVRLTPQVSGTVVAIDTDETQFVQRGQTLVKLDPHDAEVTLAQARANLAQTVRDVAQLFAQATRDAAAVDTQRVQLTQANEDVERDRPLIAVHGVSQETLQHEQNAVRGASAALRQAEATLASTRAAIAGDAAA
jgi:membrane fusion protein (multidrug efflux system)